MFVNLWTAPFYVQFVGMQIYLFFLLPNPPIVPGLQALYTTGSSRNIYRSLSPRIGQPWSQRIKANGVRSDLPPRQCGSSKRCGIEWEGSYGIFVLFRLYFSSFSYPFSILTLTQVYLPAIPGYVIFLWLSLLEFTWHFDHLFFYGNKPISYFLKPMFLEKATCYNSFTIFYFLA